MHGREAQNVQRNERKPDVKHSEAQRNEEDVNLESDNDRKLPRALWCNQAGLISLQVQQWMACLHMFNRQRGLRLQQLLHEATLIQFL